MEKIAILQFEQIVDLMKGESEKVVCGLKEDLQLNFFEQMLTVEMVAEDIGVSKATVYNWKNAKDPFTPIPFQGQPERITRREARAWFNKYSNLYKEPKAA